RDIRVDIVLREEAAVLGDPPRRKRRIDADADANVVGGAPGPIRKDEETDRNGGHDRETAAPFALRAGNSRSGVSRRARHRPRLKHVDPSCRVLTIAESSDRSHDRNADTGDRLAPVSPQPHWMPATSIL